MLKKSKITGIEMLSDAWHLAKLAKFSSSEIFNLMVAGKNGDVFGEAAMRYIYRKVGEEVSGMPAREDIDTNATRFGNLYEAEGVRKFGESKGLDFIIVQKLVLEPDSRFGSTPDGLIVMRESVDKAAYECATVEVKCPYSYDAYMRLWLCKTPEDVKKVSPQYFFQCLDQLIVCECLTGYLVIYQPHFRYGNMRVIEFKQVDLRNEVKELKARKNLAVDVFNSLREQLINS